MLIAVCALLSESGDSITVSTKVNVKEDADKESSKVIREENDCDDVCDACGVNKKMQNSLICKECEEKINE